MWKQHYIRWFAVSLNVFGKFLVKQIESDSWTYFVSVYVVEHFGVFCLFCRCLYSFPAFRARLLHALVIS